MLNTVITVLHLAFVSQPAPRAHMAAHKADVRASERIIQSEANGQQSRRRQVRNMLREEYKRARK